MISLENYRYVKEYDQTATISDDLIQLLLKKAWKVSPSKNNFMPYSVYVVGQGNQELKNAVYKLCVKGESKSNSIPDIESIRYQTIKPQYYNIISCSYLLIFTQRVETILNPWQEHQRTQGNVYSQTNESLSKSYGESLIEIGIFSTTFAELCLQNNIDVSHTLCFSKELEDWKTSGFKDILHTPVMLMTVGKGLIYRQPTDDPIEKLDLKPDFSRIVNFIK